MTSWLIIVFLLLIVLLIKAATNRLGRTGAPYASRETLCTAAER